MWDLFRKKPGRERAAHSPADVQQFYDRYHGQFKKVYGEVIQAFRTTDLSKLLDYTFESAGFREGQKLLDAGCGVAGPACYFAEKKKVQIDALTISEKQAKEAAEKVKEKGLQEAVTIGQGDYHELAKMFRKSHYDGVYFLESFGHSTDKQKLIDETWDVLKPGGVAYIKDLFLKEPLLPEHGEKINYEVGRINSAYKYAVSDLYEVLKMIRKKGFILNFVKTIDLDMNDFENLAISNEFQELTGIAQIENWEEYIFPVDFFEIKVTKPIHDLSDGLNKYFLQNLYYMQVKGLNADEL